MLPRRGALREERPEPFTHDLALGMGRRLDVRAVTERDTVSRIVAPDVGRPVNRRDVFEREVGVGPRCAVATDADVSRIPKLQDAAAIAKDDVSPEIPATDRVSLPARSRHLREEHLEPLTWAAARARAGHSRS